MDLICRVNDKSIQSLDYVYVNRKVPLNFKSTTRLYGVFICLRGLPLMTYAPRGGGGVKTDAYKCVQGGRGGLNMTKNTHFVRRFM